MGHQAPNPAVGAGAGGRCDTTTGGSNPGLDDRRPPLRLRLPRGIQSAATARRALASLGDDLEPELLDTLRLLVTELVTNSVRHADAPEADVVEVEVWVAPERVHVEVGDGGSGFDVTGRVEGQDQASGWGLHLVDRLTSRWGVRRGPGTCVWFELGRGPHLREVPSAAERAA